MSEVEYIGTYLKVLIFQFPPFRHLLTILPSATDNQKISIFEFISFFFCFLGHATILILTTYDYFITNILSAST